MALVGVSLTVSCGFLEATCYSSINGITFPVTRLTKV
jgi:hypothetical protein